MDGGAECGVQSDAGCSNIDVDDDDDVTDSPVYSPVYVTRGIADDTWTQPTLNNRKTKKPKWHR